MRRFINENSAAIVKFVTTHIVMSLLGIMVGLAILAIEGESEGMSIIAVVGSVFTIGFMCFLHYDDMFFIAEKEGIRLRAEGEPINYWKGLLIALIAYAPTLIAGLVVIGFDIFAGDVENVRAIPMLIYYAFQGSFLGLYKIRESLGLSVYVILTLLPALVSATLGYALGLKDKTLRQLFGINVKPPYDGPMERKHDKNKDK